MGRCVGTWVSKFIKTWVVSVFLRVTREGMLPYHKAVLYNLKNKKHTLPFPIKVK